MAKIINKLIAAISAAAVAASMAVPVMAETEIHTAEVGDTLEEWDYSAKGAAADWTLDSNGSMSQTLTDGALHILNGSQSATRTASKSLKSGIADEDIVIEYDIKSFSRGDNASNIYIGVSSSDYLVNLSFPKGSSSATSVSVNGDKAATMGVSASWTTPFIHVSNSVITSSKIVKTTITDENGTEVYTGTTGYGSNGATEAVQTFTASLGKYNEFYIKNFKVSEYIPSDQDVLDAAMSSFGLSEGQLGMTTEDGYYIVKRDISLPTVPDGVSLDWTLYQTAFGGDSWNEGTEFASIDGNTLRVAATDDSENYMVKAEARIAAGTAETSREYIFVIQKMSEEEAAIRYDEDFEGFEAGVLVSLASSSNSDFAGSNGLSFACGSRSESSTETGASIVSGDRGKYLSMYQTKYTGGTRQPVITLTRATEAYENGVYATFDINFSASDNELIIKDTEGTSVKVTIPSDEYKAQWLSVVLTSRASGGTEIALYDADGAAVHYKKSGASLSNLATLTMDDVTVTYMYIDNLRISDAAHGISDEDIVEAAKANLAIDDTQDSITLGDDSTYIVIDNFKLPENSITAADVSWAVYQRSADSEALEETEYASVGAGSVSINPTEGVEDHLYELVATITRGEAKDTKSFTFRITNPQAVVDEAVENVALAYAAGGAPKLRDGVYNVEKDLAFPSKGDNSTFISWSSSDSSRIDAAGVIYPNDSDESVTITATVSFKTASVTKEFTVKLPNAAATYLDPVIEALAVSSADDETVTYPAASIGTVATDIKLPSSITKINGKAFDGIVKIEWTVDSECAEIKDGIVEYMVSDFDEHDISLTAVLTYVKNDKKVCSKTAGAYSYKAQFPESAVKSDDTAYDRYKVRFDEAYADNFKSIPTYASGNITLPTEGKFGSSLTWNSSVPTTISNSGVYSKPSTTKPVIMTAAIISGSASAEKQFTVIATSGSSSSGGGGGGGGGGTVSSTTGTTQTSKSTSSVATNPGAAVNGPSGVSGAEVIERLTEEAAQAKDKFTDISGAAWARDAINGLAEAGIINGRSETQFAPNDTVTRAEFAKMLMGVFKLNSESFATSSFRDVSTGDWYFGAVETAYNLGIITGVDDGVFAPNALITRQDMAVMVSRAAAVAGREISEVNEAKSFSDAASIAAYAESAVNELVKGGIINGMSDTEFAPHSNATRAQAAKILYSFL